MLRWTLILVLLAVPALAVGQDKSKADGAKYDAPGHSMRKIEGFTVLISAETIRQDRASKLERKPLAVLESEVKSLTYLPHRHLAHLRQNVPIWVEWDVSKQMINGRVGKETAHYDPNQSKIVVSSMKFLAEVQQPKADFGQRTLLHEMVHAIHHQVLGFDNQSIQAAYKQAMERKLLDRSMYAATNHSEFFAEMTRAYFDQLDYYPRTRTDLKKNDPVTFKLMEKIWGQSPPPPPATNFTNHQTLDLPLADVLRGEPVSGPKESLQTLQGQPVLLVFWNAEDKSSRHCFQPVSEWDVELADFGLKIVAIHLGAVQNQDLASIVRRRNIQVRVLDVRTLAGKLKPGTSALEFGKFIIAAAKNLPQSLVYDHEGKCNFNGSSFDAERSVRLAVGEALLTKAGIGEPEGPLVEVVNALRAGKSPAAQLSRIEPLISSADETVKTQAQKLFDAITVVARQRLQQIDELAKTDPVGAYLKAERFSTKYKGSSLGTQAAKLVNSLKQNKSVAAEAQAQAALGNVKKLVTTVSGQDGAFNPLSSEFQTNNAATLKKLGDAVQHIKKVFPNARATEEAIRIAARYGR